MQLKTFLIIAGVAAAIVAGLLFLHGGGHLMLVELMPAIHGR